MGGAPLVVMGRREVGGVSGCVGEEGRSRSVSLSFTVHCTSKASVWFSIKCLSSVESFCRDRGGMASCGFFLS